MFFSLSKTVDARFPFSHSVGQWTFNHDEGWNRSSKGWIKGYHYDHINHGNYCEIQFENHVVKLCHDRERSFPLWWDHKSNTLSNITGIGEPIWADRKVTLTTDDIDIQFTDVPHVDLSPLGFDAAVDLIKKNLAGKFDQLLLDDSSKKLFVSGGVDTMILYSFVLASAVPVEILDYEHFEYDHFLNGFFGHIKKNFWAYNQIHHWRQPCMLLTGSCGDEFFFRGPSAVALWTAWHDIDFVDLLEKSQPGYHTHYFLLDKNKKIFKSCFRQKKEIQSQFPTADALALHLIDRNLNDHQHWHLGNTCTWTPFKDIELFKIMLRLSPDLLLQHFVDATVSKQLIAPNLLPYLSQNKNHFPRENLTSSLPRGS